MIAAAELAGMFAAHAVWCVSGGDMLIPMLAYTTENDERKMERLAHDDLGAAVEYGRQKLASNEMNANDAALIYDGRITLDDDKLDALIIEMRAFFSPDSVVMIAIPYTPKDSGQFRIHEPKVMVWENCDDFDLNHAFESFWNGVAGHEKGAAIWNECLDKTK